MYDLAARAVPESLREQPGWADDAGVVGPSDEDCLRSLVLAGAQTLGVGTSGDIADVHRLPVSAVDAVAGDAGLVRVSVPGWPRSTWATPEALGWLAQAGPARHRTTLLSPFDSLVWHRPRVERLFGMTHRLEAYTPAAKRVHGYYAMPVLHGGALVARVDPAREGRTLVARQVTMHAPRGRVSDRAVAGVGRALVEAAAWVGADGVCVDRVEPASATAAIRAAATGR